MTSREQPTILVIDDESQIRRLLEHTLTTAGYDVMLAHTGEEGIIRTGMDHPDGIILDLGLPDIDGQEVLKKIRAFSDIPVLILSVRETEQDIITALDSGADDYLTKPFRTGELIARVRATLRHRQPSQPAEPVAIGPLVVDLVSHSVRKNSELIKLTQTEFSLLALFVRNIGKVLTHKYILEQVWGHSYIDQTEYTRVYVAQLRKKLEDDPSHPSLILTESGIGYRCVAGL